MLRICLANFIAASLWSASFAVIRWLAVAFIANGVVALTDEAIVIQDQLANTAENCKSCSCAQVSKRRAQAGAFG
jgi:hypothetical protein